MSPDKIKEYLSVLTLTIVFASLSTLPMTIASFMCVAFVIALLGYTVVNYHYCYVAFNTFIVIAVYTLFSKNFLSSLTATLPMVICGILIGIAYNLKLSFLKIITTVTSVYALTFVINIKIAGIYSSGKNIFEEVISTMGQFYKTALSTAYGSGSEAEINNLVSEFTSALLRLSPSYVVIMCIIFALICLCFFKCILKIKKRDITIFTPFVEWRLNKFMSITYFILLCIYFLVVSDTLVSDIVLNIITIMNFIFFILGFSLLNFLIKRKIEKNLKRKLIFLGITVISILFMPFSYNIISLFGALDGYFNYRQKKLFNS